MDNYRSEHILEIFNSFSLKPDLILTLQDITKQYQHNQWIEKLKQVPKTLISDKFIYKSQLFFLSFEN